MKIFITGICGFIGANLSRALIDLGNTVDGADDLSTGLRENLPQGAHLYKIDIASDYFVFSKANGYIGDDYDLIIHLAAKKIPRDGAVRETLISNVLGVKNVVDLALAKKSKLLFMSTSDIYGKQSSFSEFSDSVIGPPWVGRWSYAISKMWGEQLLYATEGLDFRIIRLFGAYGPFQSFSWKAGAISVFIDQALRGEPYRIFDTGQQARCFEYIDDAVDGVLCLIDSWGLDIEAETFNIGNPNESVAMVDLARKIHNIVNPGKPFLTHSASQTFDNKPFEEINKRIPDIDMARTFLGFEPKISLDEGLRRTINWQKAVYIKKGIIDG